MNKYIKPIIKYLYQLDVDYNNYGLVQDTVYLLTTAYKMSEFDYKFMNGSRDEMLQSDLYLNDRYFTFREKDEDITFDKKQLNLLANFQKTLDERFVIMKDYEDISLKKMWLHMLATLHYDLAHNIPLCKSKQTLLEIYSDIPKCKEYIEYAPKVLYNYSLI